MSYIEYIQTSLIMFGTVELLDFLKDMVTIIIQK